MVFPMPHLESVFESFGWQAHSVDATQYAGVYAALQQFKQAPRNGKPTAIICNSTKGHGAFSDFLNKHKVVMTDAQIGQELALQNQLRRERVREAGQIKAPAQMHLNDDLTPRMGPVLTKRVPRRDKKIRYDAALLPRIDRAKEYAASDIVTAAMKVFANDSRVVSIDSDLATTSGLEAGIAAVDQKRALNVGVAEANMMCIGEAFAALGYNTWISTFCPFFDWKILRRVAVGHQERLESIGSPQGWLSEGHGLDLTMLATGPNFETRTNGATHMGNDDITVFDGIAHLKIIDVCCPQQMLAIMKWIMEGNRGLIYLRVMRTPSAVVYGDDYVFQFSKGHVLKESPDDRAIIITSNRGVHEALAASALEPGIGVVDMPSIDEPLLLKLYDSGKKLCFAEQNNGYLLDSFLKILYRHRKRCDWDRIIAVNTLDANGMPQFIHSGTYEELLDAFHLSAAQLAQKLT